MADWAELPEVVIGQILDYVEILDMFCISKTCTSWENAVFRPGAWKHLNISGEKLFLQISCNMMCLDEMVSDVQLSTELLSFIEKGSRFTKYFKITLCRWFDIHILEKVLANGLSLRLLEISIWFLYSKEELDQKVSEIVADFLKETNTVETIRMHEVPATRKQDESDINNSSSIIYPPIPFGVFHAQNLRELWLVNSFESHSLSNIMYLINLSELAINPQQLNYSLLLHLAAKSLRNLFIVANENTKGVYNAALNSSQWNDIRESGPELRVHCYFSCRREWTEQETIFKPNMPLKSLVYRKNVWLRYPCEISHFMTSYSGTIEEFIDYSLSELTYEQGHASYIHDYNSRIDNWLIIIAKNCPKLKWLTAKEPLSSAAILLIACLNPNIQQFLVRDDMIMYKNDVPDDVFPDENTKNLVSVNCKTSMELSEKMSDLLHVAWKPYARTKYFDILNRKYQKFKHLEESVPSRCAHALINIPLSGNLFYKE